MSVSRSGDTIPSNVRSSAWEDYEHFFTAESFNVATGRLNGGAQSFGPNGADYEILGGGLHRGEIAELVAVILESTDVQITEQSGSGTEPGQAIFEYETARGEFGDQVDPASIGGEEDLENKLERTKHGYDLNRDEILHFRAFASQSFNDTANGTGGGGDIGTLGAPSVINFRDEMGVGPIFDNDTDTLRTGATVLTKNLTNEPVDAKVRMRYVFDVMEQGDVPDRLLP
jgi:hypothetical protein